jgi:polyisoprenoid-binding protein YceI
MRTALFALSLLSLSGCVEDVGKDRVTAKVEDVPAATATKVEAPQADVVKLKVDPASSSINALGAKITATHPIVWKDYTGEISVVGDTLHAVQFTVQMATLEADHPKLTAHLKDADFFDAPTHPTSTFTSTEIKAGSDAGGEWTHTVVGDMTIRGTTKRLTFPAKVTVEPGQVMAKTEFVINRQDFGVTYPGKPDDLVQDNVRMNIELVAPRS